MIAAHIHEPPLFSTFNLTIEHQSSVEASPEKHQNVQLKQGSMQSYIRMATLNRCACYGRMYIRQKLI